MVGTRLWWPLQHRGGQKRKAAACVVPQYCCGSCPPSPGHLCQVNVERTGKSPNDFAAGHHGPDPAWGISPYTTFPMSVVQADTQMPETYNLRVISRSQQ